MRVLIYLLLTIKLNAEVIRVAVASNFNRPIQEIKTRFEKTTPLKIQLIFGSSGKLFAQIVNGAPFDIFLSADKAKIEALIEMNIGDKESRFTYAIGRLALWSPNKSITSLSPDSLKNIQKIAIANPRTAPYGQAAMSLFENMGIVELIQEKLVYGESVSQCYQFIYTANAELGFVAYSQVYDQSSSILLIDEAMHKPILQDALLIRDSIATRSFYDYLSSEEIKILISSFGYSTKSATNEP